MSSLLDARIKMQTFIFASPEKVYSTITSAKEWDSFFTTGMELDPRPGGVCSFAWKDWGPNKYTLKVPGRVTEAVQASVFSFEWGREGRQTSVRFELADNDGGTVVVLAEDGYRDDRDGRAMIVECASGWGEALTLLKFYMEHNIIYTSATDKGKQ